MVVRTASKGQKTHPGPICTIMQNFMPICAKVADMSVTGHSKKTATNIFRKVLDLE